MFGPILTIIKVPNDSAEECIKLVNQFDFGLGSSILAALAIGLQFRKGILTMILDDSFSDFGAHENVGSNLHLYCWREEKHKSNGSDHVHLTTIMAEMVILPWCFFRT